MAMITAENVDAVVIELLKNNFALLLASYKVLSKCPSAINKLTLHAYCTVWGNMNMHRRTTSLFLSSKLVFCLKTYITTQTNRKSEK